MELGPILVFLTSLVPVPLCLFLNSQKWILQPQIIFWVGVVTLTLLLVVPYLAIRRMKRQDLFLKVMPLYLFSSVVDLFIALESDGILSEFVSFYIKEGEPYLFTSYGTMICYWDGIVHYSFCLYILYCIVCSESYRKFGLFIGGSYINSLLVLIPGSMLGNIGVKWAVLLNVPYVFIPVWVTFRLLKNRPADSKKRDMHQSILSRPMDIVFIVYFLFAIIVDLLRGFIALGCQAELLQEYLSDHEPYIMHPSAYPKVQMIVNMVYYVPYYVCAIYGLLNPGQPWLPDWALILAGGAAQGQFSHIGGTFHWKTNAQYRVPARAHSQQIFWLLNIALFIVPQLFAYRLNTSDSEKSEVNKND